MSNRALNISLPSAWMASRKNLLAVLKAFDFVVYQTMHQSRGPHSNVALTAAWNEGIKDWRRMKRKCGMELHYEMINQSGG